MIQLNLYPYYEELITSQKKTTTIRLGDKTDRFRIGEEISITVGWDEKEGVVINNGKIVDVRLKKINELNDNDLNGESPDCVFKDSVKYVISSIYRKIVNDDDLVTIVKWAYKDGERI